MNKGGIITYLEGIQSFIPKSHIFTKGKIINYNKLKNRRIKCKLLNFNENKNQLILSNKSANFSILKHKFKLGEIVYGKIIVKKTYGVFIEIYNVNALLHNSEISNKNIPYKNTSIKIGQFIKAKIIYLNNKEGLVSVSIRHIKCSLTPLQQY